MHILYKLIYVTIFINKPQLPHYIQMLRPSASLTDLFLHTQIHSNLKPVSLKLFHSGTCLSHTNCYAYSFVTVMSASSNFSTAYTHHCLLPLWPPWRKQRKETPAQKRTDFMLVMLSLKFDRYEFPSGVAQPSWGSQWQHKLSFKSKTAGPRMQVQKTLQE